MTFLTKPTVTGVIGCMQALEAIKIITGIGSSFTSKLLLFDGIDGTFRSVKVRPRRKDCAVCGDTPTITQLQDYVQFCGMAATDKDLGIDILEPSRRIECVEYEKLRKQDGEHVLIDTRDALQTDICKLEEALSELIWRVWDSMGNWRLLMRDFAVERYTL